MNGNTRPPTSNGVQAAALANRRDESVEYVGFSVDGRAVVLNLSDHRRLTPERSLAPVNHSPSGFEWGYGGSGPAHLAHFAPTGDYTEAVVERFDAAEGWAANHAFCVAEPEAHLETAGLEPERVVAFEGPTANRHDELEDAPAHVAEAARTIAAEWREDRALADVSEHFLVVARPPDS